MALAIHTGGAAHEVQRTDEVPHVGLGKPTFTPIALRTGDVREPAP
ncbi:hypothetical protein [Streptomyces sp. NPDC002588]